MKPIFTKRRIPALLALFSAGIFFLLTPSAGLGYQVPPLPEDNLIVNPWFRSAAEPNTPGLDGWTPEYNQGLTWGLSQKISNPAPDDITSGKCGPDAEYCGTGARWAHELEVGGSDKHPNIDVYIYQVVQADPGERKLSFFMYFVNHRLDIGEAVISGGESPTGPWEEVWVPASISQHINPGPDEAPGRYGNPWFSTPMLETILDQGYPYYKVVLHARYPESESTMGDVGVKITGVYFSVRETDDPGVEPTSWVVVNPTLAPSGETVSKDGSTPVPQPTAEGVTQPAPTDSEAAAPTESPDPRSTTRATEIAAAPPTQTSERTREATATATPEPAPPPAQNVGSGLILGFLAGLLGAGAVLIAVVVIRSAMRKV